MTDTGPAAETDALPMLPERRFDEPAMRAYCEARGARLLRVLQQAAPATEAKAGVALVLDGDGIVKVFKEELPHGDITAGPHETESGLHEAANGLPFVPRQYGAETWNGITILRQSVSYGRELTDWRAERLSPVQLRSVIGRLAAMLDQLHARGIVHMDVWERNIKVDGDALSLFDLGDARFIRNRMPCDPAGPKSKRPPAQPMTDMWLLGELAFQMLRFDGADSALEKRVMDLRKQNPSTTPTMQELAEEFGTDAVSLPSPIGERRTLPDVGTVLFPARMGIPHRGHVDFMARVMELGFPLVISLQCAYTLSPIDPLHKWTVLQMVTASLRRRGFVAGEDFRFVFTPLFDNDEQHRMHFALMPGMDEVVAVASGNPDVHALFAGRPIIDQRAVFGHEGEEYEVRSWGEQLREAVRTGDRAAFDQLAAEGVEEVLPFELLRSACAGSDGRPLRPPCPVSVSVSFGDLKLVTGRVQRYLSPHESAVRLLRTAGFVAELVDPYAADMVVQIDGERYRLTMLEVGESEGKTEIRFGLFG